MTKLKNKPFRLTFSHLIRFSLFIGLVYFFINFLSTNPSTPVFTDSPVLGDQTQFSHILQSLPPQTQDQIQQLPNSPIVSQVSQYLNDLLSRLEGFPQKQIDQFKIELVKKISSDIINSIETNQAP